MSEQPFPHFYWKFTIKKYFWPFFPIFVLLVVALTSFYTVQPDEKALILRLGKYKGQYGPGLHLKMPFAVDRVYKIKITQIRTQEFGFRTRSVGVQSDFEKGQQGESLMLTGDLNIAEVAWIVQYKVSDPKNYLIEVREKVKNLRDISETVMREVVGDHSIDSVLTFGREKIENEAKQKMQKIVDRYKMGLEIKLVKLRNVAPPKRVEKSFNEVNEARQEQQRKKNEALAQYNQTIPKAKGEAEQRISQAKGYKTEKLNIARGDTSRFNALLEEYRKAKDITKKRLYLEAMNDIYIKVGKKIIIDEDVKSILPLIDLEKMQK